jgi:uncharacterized protein with GYD domain
MSMYLYIGSYSAEGRKGLMAEGGSSREAATRALFESMGGSVERYAFAMGSFDFVIIADMPDDRVALIPPLIANSTGTVSVTTTKLLTPLEMDAVTSLAQSFTFRKAGA